jgi:hypothetical protein
MRDGCWRERLARAFHHPDIVDEHGRILAGRSRRDHHYGIVRPKFVGEPACGPGGEKIGLGTSQRQHRHAVARQQTRARPADKAVSTQDDHAPWRRRAGIEVLEHGILSKSAGIGPVRN